MRGSVSARFRVRFSRISAARKHSRSAVRTSMPPGSMASRPASPATTWSDALRLAPASVSVSEPGGKSKAARFWRPLRAAWAGFQCRRPAIIRCSTSQRSPSRPMAMRFPTPPQFAHGSSLGFGERRRGGSKKKRAGQPEAFEREPDHARFERGDIGGDVRQLGHIYSGCMAAGGLARGLGGAGLRGSGGAISP